MANYFVNDTRYQNSNNANGASVNQMVLSFPVTTAANATGDILRICTLPSNAVLTSVVVGCTAITSLTNVDFGIYDTLENGGAVLDADLFMDGQTLASASKVLDGLSAVSVENAEKNITELATSSVLANDKFIDLALTLNATPTADGFVSIKISYII